MKTKLSFILKLIVTIVILYFVLSPISFEEYHKAFALLSFELIAVIFLLVIIQVFFLALRWYVLAKRAGSQISLAGSIFGILMSFFFSQGLPASIGGDAFRLWWHRREGIETSAALRIIFFDRIYGMLSLVFLCLISVSLLAYLLEDHSKVITVFILTAITGFLLGFWIMPWRVGVSAYLERAIFRFPNWVKSIIRWLITTRLSLIQQLTSTTLFLLGIGLCIHICVILQVYVVGHILSPNIITMMVCLAAIPPALFISYMPFSIAGWGVREVSMVVALGLFGVQDSIAIFISLFIGMIILCFSLVGGLLWFLGGYKSTYLLQKNKNTLLLDPKN